MSTTFNPSGTSARFASYIAQNHSDSCISARRAELLAAVSDAFSMYVRSDNRTDIEKIIASIRDKDAGGALIRAGVRAAFDAYPKGFTPTKEYKSFKTMPEDKQAPYITGHAAMVAAFESAITNYGVKIEKTEAEKEKAKIEKQARAEKKLNDTIKALGLVDPTTIRPLDNATIIGLVIDACRAKELALADLEMLAADVSAALDIARTEQALAKANMKTKAERKAKAESKAKAEKLALSKEPQYVQNAVASALA